MIPKATQASGFLALVLIVQGALLKEVLFYWQIKKKREDGICIRWGGGWKWETIEHQYLRVNKIAFLKKSKER